MPQLRMLVSVGFNPWRAKLIVDNLTATQHHRVVQRVPAADIAAHCGGALSPILAVLLFQEAGRTESMARPVQLSLTSFVGLVLFDDREPPDLGPARPLRHPHADFGSA